ncbi:D-glycero-alpha-D-manno-heptose-1,7-bisphosphate 7-phosphatase [Croceibacterium ferulae]|uniref:D-glycero-alpha-D-manno-heptose-1,7-bisphosphate 7-phosphatase n=1 Tax=Croceibacterium ferulae TaxID=1854641 RepID=UPI000EB18037|nr:HAD family hydrolase [Croceibacterium ferulae]
MRAAAFLDRDGVLMEDRGYVARAQDVCLLPGTGAALRQLVRAGYLLIVVTNQSGIGRGLFDEQALQDVHRRLTVLLAAEDVLLDAIYHCPHAPAAGCACRKPLPGLLDEAASRFPVNRERSFMVGDKPSDVAAGQAAGLGRTYLIGSPGLPDLLSCVAKQLALMRVSGS